MLSSWQAPLSVARIRTHTHTYMCTHMHTHMHTHTHTCTRTALAGAVDQRESRTLSSQKEWCQGCIRWDDERASVFASGPEMSCFSLKRSIREKRVNRARQSSVWWRWDKAEVPVLVIEATFISFRTDESCWSLHPQLALSALTKGCLFFFSGSNAISGMPSIWFILTCGLEIYFKEIFLNKQDPIVEHREVHEVSPDKPHCKIILRKNIYVCMNIYAVYASQVVLVVKNPPANAEDLRDMGSIPGWGRSPGGGHGNPLQDSCLENPMDRGFSQATVYGVGHDWATKHTYTYIYVCVCVCVTESQCTAEMNTTLRINYT